MTTEQREKAYDLAIIGGGINGVAIAADAAGRGLRVVLYEQADLASGTSSASSKLIHGGLRYLEYFEFKLVREALREREILLKKAPHLIKPLRFILPYNTHMRPAWMIQCGLFLYDHLARRDSLPSSKSFVLQDSPYSNILLPEFKKAFAYSDCWVDDARLVLATAQLAREKSAEIYNYTKVINTLNQDNFWTIDTENTLNGEKNQCMAKCIVNASGPWLEETQKQLLNINTATKLSLVKGSHIILKKLYDQENAFILQNPDGRIIFILPYLKDFTLIGTTEKPYSGVPKDVSIDEEEIQYLITSVNAYLQKPVQREDIIHSFSGVRPLQLDEHHSYKAISRDYSIEIKKKEDALYMQIIGGKITTHRALAEEALNHLHPYFPSMGKAWTEKAILPGGDILDKVSHLKNQYDWLPENLFERYINTYGSRITVLLQNCKNLKDLGECISSQLYEREVEYLKEYEWAKTMEDILWRRTHLGMTTAGYLNSPKATR